MLGPGLEEWWRYPVRFPGCASHFFGACWEGVFLDFYTCWGMWGDTFERGWGHFLVGSGSLFRHFWDVLGSVWEWSGDIFRQILEGFEKMSDGVRKLKFSKMAGSIFPESGRFRIVCLTYPRSTNIQTSKENSFLQ